MKTLILASSLLAGLSLPLVACSSSSTGSDSSSVTATEYDDVAQNVGASTSQSGGDVTAMGDISVIASGTLPLGFVLGADGMISGTFLGITYSFQLSCRDGQGNDQPECNSNTQIADASVDWSGNLTLPNFSTQMARHGDWSLMNIQDSTVKFAGNGTFSFDSSITNPNANVTTAYHFDYDAAYMSVFVDKASGFATSGEITYDIDAKKTVTGQADRTFSVNADITFEGNGTAAILLDGTHHYTLDLATHAVVKID